MKSENVKVPLVSGISPRLWNQLPAHEVRKCESSPRLWNQLPAPLRQPRTNLSNSASPSSMSGITVPVESYTIIISLQSYFDYWYSITHSLFHSRLKSFLFC